MKKYFMIAAAALLIASCAKESDALYEGAAQSGEVTFSAFAKNAMKSYVTSSEFYDWDFANLRDASGNVKESVSADASHDAVRTMQLSVYNEEGKCDLFVNETYQREEDNKWHANPHKFYPIGYGDFDFLAYSISSGDADCETSAITWNGAKKVTFEVTSTSLEDDILYAGGVQKASAHAPADMLFKHAQAWITVRFTVDASSDAYNKGGAIDAEDNTILSIDEAVWQDIYKSGELTLVWKDGQPSETGATANHKADATATWNFFTQETSNVVMPDRAATTDATYGYPVATKDYLVKNSYLDMLIPEQNKQALVINYTLGGEQFSYTIDLDKIKNADAKWKMGYHYIYNIEFAITEITTAPSVVVWTEVYGFNGDAKDEGDPLKL